MNLSCAAICKNEEHNVVEFLKNLKKFNIKNLYITDTGSTDDTVRLIHKNWPNNRLYFSSIDIAPFDFSVARNSNQQKIVSDEKFIIHLDLDERIETLPRILEDNTLYLCCRKELLWGTTSFSMPRITPAHDWYWEFPIHENLSCRHAKYGTDLQCNGFTILHCQNPEKDFYSELTEAHFEREPIRLFFHRMCDLFRENNWKECVRVFDLYWKDVREHLQPQQQWQMIRNYQVSRVKCKMLPDRDLLKIFHQYPSSSSYYYLSLFNFYLGNFDLFLDYAKTADTVTDHVLNTTFNNKNIKKNVNNLIQFYTNSHN